MVLGQSYDCPSVCEATLKNMAKWNTRIQYYDEPETKVNHSNTLKSEHILWDALYRAPEIDFDPSMNK